MFELSIFLVVLLVVAFAGAGIFLLTMALTSGRKSRPNLSWPSVKGKVLSSEIVESSGMTEDGMPFSTFKSVIRFKYQVNGIEYVSIQIGQASTLSDDNTLKLLADKYPVGNSVVVYFDPQNPAEAILSQQVPVARPIITAGIILLLVALLIACVSFSIFLVYFFTH